MLTLMDSVVALVFHRNVSPVETPPLAFSVIGVVQIAPVGANVGGAGGFTIVTFSVNEKGGIPS